MHGKPSLTADFLASGGETGALMRAYDWSKTSLGPIETWPQSLKTATAIVLGSPVPMVMLWGEDGVMIYNDAYSIFAGGRHPRLLGSKVREGWPEVADFNDRVMRTGLAGGTLHLHDQELTLHRHGRPEQVWMNLDYSPVLDESGKPAGVLAVVIETTERVAAERRRQAAEAALRAERDRLQGVLQNMGEAFVLLDREFRVLDINAEGMRLEGRRREAILGKTHWEAWPGSEGSEQGRLYKRAMAERMPVGVDVHYTWPDGRDGWFEARAYPIDDGLAIFYRDITDRKRADDALREREERLRLVVDGATDYAILTTDPERRVTSWSPGAQAAFGYPAEQIIGRSADLLFTPEDRAAGRPDEEAETARREGVAPDVRWHQREDGSRVFLNGSVRPLRSGEGREIGFLKIARDETQRRQAEERLRESEARFRTLADVVPNIVWFASPDGALHYLNDRWYAYTGQTPEEALPNGWAATLHPDDAERIAAVWADARAHEVTYEAEVRYRRSDGAHRWYVARAEPLRDAAGRVTGWFGASTDIHDRKAAEEALRELNATLALQVAERTRERDRIWAVSQDLLAVAGFDGYLRAINPAWTRVLGYDEATLLARPFTELIHPDDLEAAAAVVTALQQGRITQHFVDRLRRVDGGHAWISWTAVPEGDVFYAVGRDITAQQEQAEALRQAEEALRQAQKMEAVGQLTGGIAHDFNNLLAGIVGSLDLMQTRLSQGRSEGIERYAKAAMSSAQRAAALTHRLLAFARRQPLDPKPVNANQLVTGMEDLLRRTIGPLHALELVTAGGLWTTLCDPNQLESAILNLAINARDAMPEGGKLTIETCNAHLDDAYAAAQRDVTPGQYVCICITDTGIGMPPDLIARASEPFFTTKPLGQGTGLGLSMVYGFAKQSEGHLKIYSEVGQGTTVKIYLPRHRGAAEEEGAGQRLVEAPRAEAGETVLIVEDEPVIRDLIVEVLQDLGYRALEAADGPSGLKILQSKKRIDLLVTDVGLPGLNGRQLADHARERRPGLKVLFITGYAENATLANGFLDPGMEMITKPFAVETLATKIRTMIRGL
jgi:PAS domain S-box-containing protein